MVNIKVSTNNYPNISKGYVINLGPTFTELMLSLGGGDKHKPTKK